MSGSRHAFCSGGRGDAETAAAWGHRHTPVALPDKRVGSAVTTILPLCHPAFELSSFLSPGALTTSHTVGPCFKS